jgi:hypothetical protein
VRHSQHPRIPWLGILELVRRKMVIEFKKEEEK